jgi:uncharacterized membrane protein YccC
MPAGIAELLGGALAPMLAYIGPGADLALISSAIGLILTMGSSMIFLVLWPFRSLWRRLRGLDDQEAGDENSAADSSSRAA